MSILRSIKKKISNDLKLNNVLLDDNVITVAICLEFRSRHEPSVAILNENDDEISLSLVT